MITDSEFYKERVFKIEFLITLFDNKPPVIYISGGLFFMILIFGIEVISNGFFVNTVRVAIFYCDKIGHI